MKRPHEDIVKVLKRYPGITGRMDLSVDHILVSELAAVFNDRLKTQRKYKDGQACIDAAKKRETVLFDVSSTKHADSGNHAEYLSE